MMDRRASLALGGLAAAGLALGVGHWPVPESPPRRSSAPDGVAWPGIAPGTRLLFQGDSITDAHRDRTVLLPNQVAGLGRGHVAEIAETLLQLRPHDGLSILNRGIGGDTVPKLLRRWEQDTLALRPDLLTVLVGFNDMRRARRGRGTVASFTRGYEELLARVRESRHACRIIVCVPFVVTGGVPAARAMLRELRPYQQAVREIARRRQVELIDFQAALDRAEKRFPRALLAKDAVHPEARGARVLADTWLDHVART